MKKPNRVSTEGGSNLGANPFGALDGLSLPSQSPAPAGTPVRAPAPRKSASKKDRGRVDVLRSKAGRGGKTVTVVAGFVGIGAAEKADLAKAMQRACGVGGTVKEGRIEIQGDKRDEICRILTDAGFRPVLAGG